MEATAHRGESLKDSEYIAAGITCVDLHRVIASVVVNRCANNYIEMSTRQLAAHLYILFIGCLHSKQIIVGCTMLYVRHSVLISNLFNTLVHVAKVSF